MSSAHPRSARLVHYKSVAANFVAVYLCGANQTTIVKSVVVYNSTAATLDARVLLQDSTNTATAILAQEALTAGKSTEFDTGAVLQPGDAIVIYAGGAGVVFWISGSVLEGIPVINVSTTELPLVLDWPPPTIP